MKIKCSKCGKMVNKRKDILENNVKKANVSVEEYLKNYLCKDCRKSTKDQNK